VNTAKALDYTNQALQDIGEAPITAWNDGSLNADMANRRYEQVVRDLLSRHRWEFATVQATLARVTSVTPTIDWSYAFALPTDPAYIRMVRMARDADSLQGTQTIFWPGSFRRLEYAIRASDDGNSLYLLTHWTTCYVEYIGRVNEQLFSPAFEECIVLTLAARFAEAITDKPDLASRMMLELMGEPRAGRPGKLMLAKLEDSRNSPNPGFVDDAGLISGR